MTGGPVGTILWAQWRTLLNHSPRMGGPGRVIGLVLTACWYLAWTWAATAVAFITANPESVPWIKQYLGYGLLGIIGYWQLMPLMLASTGASLDLKRLLVYPIPRNALYRIELLLRVTTGVETILLLAGLSAGTLINPALSKFGLAGVGLFTVFNLCLAAGLRGVLQRLFRKRGARELGVLILVTIAVLPQLVLSLGLPPGAAKVAHQIAGAPWPWTLTAWTVAGDRMAFSLLGLGLWTGAAWLFGRRQFERSLQFDAEGPGVPLQHGTAGERWVESLYRLPSRVFADPLGALIEKELRFLSRAPRFRLVFLMGFTFGLIIWLPAAYHRGHSQGNFLAQNYLVSVSAYSLLLLGEVCFWNAFGFDRGAAQLYFVAPLEFRTVLRAKNITAAFFVMAEITIIIIVCQVAGLPAGWMRIAEAYSVAIVLALLLLAMGNLGSVYYPRPVNPVQSWRTSAPGRVQAYLLLLLPVMGTPVALAFLARYAFDSEAAFFVVMAIDAAIATAVYSIATESAVNAALRRRELLIAALSQTEGPISG
ncbi:MAG: hypothetical protein IT160_04560 [Bryobacterales bacterium]|nr:hypothetical protein [Bryobacterales bacterium]